MKISHHCYAVLGLGYYPPWTVNSGFICGSKKTLIVDSGPNYPCAQTIFGYASSVNSTNEIVVMNTEKHLDHIGGNSFFKEKSINIYGHKLINRKVGDLSEDIKYYNKSILNKKRREEKEESFFYENTKIVNPDFALDGNETFDLGEIEVFLLSMPGHTPTNISIWVPSDKVLYCGDSITNGFIPNLDDGTKEDWITWINSLDKISELDIKFIVPGHGNVIAEPQKEISRIKNILENSINTGKTPTEE